MRKRVLFIFVLIAFCMIGITAFAANRFPHPEFESGYGPPRTTAPAPKLHAHEILDVIALTITIALTCYMALGTRSRRGILLTSVLAILYFGFYRKGCVCSVGAIQNVTAAMFNSGYFLPITVVFLFVLPLVTALFFGRMFCASVCPLGAIQDVVILSPRSVPRKISAVLGLFPVVYLGLAILLAANGARFIICQYDPFVSFFRFGGSLGIMLTGAALLIIGTVIARPYCRFICPYGVLLGWFSRFCKFHTTITPDECIECRLCEDACPFDAIRKPEPGMNAEEKKKGIKRLSLLLVLLPFLVLGGGWLGSRLHSQLALLHPTVNLVKQIQQENSGARTETTIATRTFRESGTSDSELFERVEKIESNFLLGSWILGAFIGLVIGGRLIFHSISRKRKGYTQDEGLCFSCGRCFISCPVDNARRKAEDEE
jgi:ferredoxin